jgi:L-ascorbate metabolism protein UlaG (beta-lactamase superfamily)
MDPKEAAMAARLLGAKTVLPIHWGTFPLLTGTPQELASQVDTNVKVEHWSPGETL